MALVPTTSEHHMARILTVESPCLYLEAGAGVEAEAEAEARGQCLPGRSL